MVGMKRYPRSFLQLVTLGQIIVILPLVVALGYAAFTLDRLSDHYQLVVQNVADSGRLVSELSADIQRMERHLRRHEILGNEETLQDYVEVRDEWRQHMQAFLQLKILPPVLTDDLESQLALETATFDRFLAERDLSALRGTLDEIRTRADVLGDQVHELIERDQLEVHDLSAQLMSHLTLAVVLAVLAAILSIWLIRRLLSRLIGRFERAVLALGRGELNTPILLDGPGDLRWLGRWLEWLRKRLLSLENARTQVLRHVSHELKTPLAALQEGSSLLAEQIPGPMTPAQLKILGIIQGNAKRLQALIEGLLRLQQAEHAAERIGFETLDYTHLVQQVVDTHRLIAQERQISFALDLAAVTIIAGREALQTIVHNLVSNAVKFSPPGGTVQVALSQEGQNAILSVTDSGPGIPESELTAVFEPFFRSASTRQQVAGVGLGLAIAREFVLAQRGEIVARNTAAGGACFRVVLPLTAPYLRRPEHG